MNCREKGLYVTTGASNQEGSHRFGPIGGVANRILMKALHAGSHGGYDSSQIKV